MAHDDGNQSISETIETDPTRLQQILINLIGNSIKFTESGRVHLALELTESSPPQLCFDIQDTGIGMKPEQASVIFSLSARPTRRLRDDTEEPG